MSMIFLWVPMGFKQDFYGTSMICSEDFFGNSYGISMRCLENVYGSSMIFLWDFYLVPVGFHWYCLI